MTKRIKILFTIPNFDTAGSGKVVYDLVKGLDKTRFEPEICCVHDKGVYFKVIETLGVKIHLFQFTTPYRPFLTFPFRVFKIMRFFKQNQFDLIHSWHWSSDISEPLAAKLSGIPFVYTKKAMGWGNKSWVWRSKLSTKVIAINLDMVNGFLSPFSKKLKYIPLGVDTQIFQPLQKTRNTPNGLHFGENDFVIVSIANLAPVKGIETLLNAVISLENSKIKLVIVGDYKNDYGKKLIANYKDSRVFFEDKQLDVRPYLALANVFVIPTKKKGEGLPLALLEAMASCRIAIGSKVSGIKDVLGFYPNLLFESENVLDLRDKLLKVFNLNKKDISHLEYAMRNEVLNRFGLDQCIKNHQDFYLKMLK